MKAIFLKVLRLTGIDALLLGLVEKLMLGLVKKLTQWQITLKNLLDEPSAASDG